MSARGITAAPTLGEHLRRRRRSLDDNQERVAEIIGVNQSTVAKWENGTAKPSREHLVRIAEYLDVTPGELFVVQTLGEIASDESLSKHSGDSLAVALSKSHYYALSALASARGTTLAIELERAVTTFLKGLQ